MNRILNRVIIAGGSGDLGRSLISYFNSIGIRSVVLSRSGKQVPGSVKTVQWLDGSDDWISELHSARAIINLCGEPISQRWSSTALERIRQSRIEPTTEIGKALSVSPSVVPMWIQLSGIGLFGDRREEAVDEHSEPNSDSLAKICQEWESVAMDHCPTDTKLAIVRPGPVFDPQYGYLRRIIEVTNRGMGGTVGSGDQWISWISSRDFTRTIGFVLENECSGVYNAVSPKPVRQRELSRLVCQHLDQIIAPRAPEFLVRIMSPLMGIDPSLVLQSLYVLPKELLSAGFQFADPDLQKYLHTLPR